MTQLEDLIRPSAHVCHVCTTKYPVKYLALTNSPLPSCCPVCDAPMRVSQIPIGNTTSHRLLHSLGGAPIDSFNDSNYRKLAEFQILKHARTCADIDAVINEVRAACSRLRSMPQSSAPPSDDPYEVSKTTAKNRLREQLESGLLEWRLKDLREQAIALLRAEHEHHQYVYAVRQGQ